MNRHERTYAFPRTTAIKLRSTRGSPSWQRFWFHEKKTALLPLARQQFDVRSTNAPTCASKITPIALRLFSASFPNHFCRTYGQFTFALRGNPNAFRDFPHARYDSYLAPYQSKRSCQINPALNPSCTAYLPYLHPPPSLMEKSFTVRHLTLGTVVFFWS